MRKHLTLLLLATSLSLGCAKQVVAPVPGQLNTFDAYTYRVLYDSQAAINSFKASPSAQNASIKPILNSVISDYDIAESAYQTWRSTGGTGSTTAVSQAVTKMQADFSNLANAVSGK